MWAWPFALALAFACGVAGWLQWSDMRETEDDRQQLISDALTLQARLQDAIGDEQNLLQRLANELRGIVDGGQLLRHTAVVEGLSRLWVSVTLLDGSNRIAAQVPQDVPRGEGPQPIQLPQGGSTSSHGLTAHLSTPLAGGGRLIVRIAPLTLLQKTVPWWLTRQYEVRLVDGFGQTVAAPAEPASLARDDRPWHRVSLEPALADTYLELLPRSVRVPWWRTLPLLLAFLLLSAGATLALRRQILEVAGAESRWRGEAAWRRSIEDSLTVGLRGRDLEGRLVHVNRAFCDLVGFAPEDLLGRLPPMPYWLPDDMSDSLARHQRNMSGGAPREGYEARWQHRDGHPIDVIIFEAPLVDAQGRQTGWMGSIIDITARHLAEERERRQLDLLAAQARLTTLGEVASALAHQLNQPLAAITGYTDGLRRALADAGAQPRLLQAAERVSEQAAEAGRIVQRIRVFLTRRAPQPERCELPPLVARVMALLRRDLQAAGVELKTRYAPGLPAVLADSVLIEQVLINLLRNALDEFAAHGTSTPRVLISVAPDGARFVRVDVEDNGPGLGGRGIDTLAEPFHSSKPAGMGMGLSICRSVVEAHHGSMEAGTMPGGGARLSFVLPVCEEMGK
jgi:two-component system sensor histidine kinase DctS